MFNDINSEKVHPRIGTLNGLGPFLAEEATAYLLDKLSRYGNTVSADHRTALTGLTWLAERVAKGDLSGRFRYGLPCGMGKTTAVRAFLRAIAKLDLPYPVIVASSKVEQLCSLKRQLINEDEVPESLVGLMHSYEFDAKKAEWGREGYASEPSEGHERQFLLVTHSNVKAGKLKDWMKQREGALMFFDETLVVSEAMAIYLIEASRNSLLFESAGLQALATQVPNYSEAAEWAKVAVNHLVEAVKDHSNDEVRLVNIPLIDPDKAAEFKRLRIFNTEMTPNLSLLLQLAEQGATLRLFTNSEKNRALVSYTVTVPDELQNIIVLDASDSIREIVHHDARMQRAEDVVPLLSKFKDVPGGLSSIKRNDRVRIFFANDAGGRKTMRKEFSEGDSGKSVAKMVRLIKANPEKRFLVFVYKDRSGEPKYKQAVFNALRRAGIEPTEGIENRTPRVNVLTWGMETASNEYTYCDAVVLLGVIFQPEESIAGTFLGQVDDIKSPVVHSALRRLQYSECVHSIYQAANRGSMRVVDTIDGRTQAKACDLYVIHNDAALRTKLENVMAGASWYPWREPGEDTSASDVAMLIVEKLKELAKQGIDKVSLRSLRQEVEVTVPSSTWKRARDAALEQARWTIQGSSLIAPLVFEPVA